MQIVNRSGRLHFVVNGVVYFDRVKALQALAK